MLHQFLTGMGDFWVFAQSGTHRRVYNTTGIARTVGAQVTSLYISRISDHHTRQLRQQLRADVYATNCAYRLQPQLARSQLSIYGDSATASVIETVDAWRRTRWMQWAAVNRGQWSRVGRYYLISQQSAVDRRLAVWCDENSDYIVIGLDRT